MNELLKVNYDNERITLSARELHQFLGIGTRFNVWFPRMKEYGFNENIDFQRVAQKCDTLGGLQDVVDYQITLDMAKEIAMIQRSEKGKQVRQYFIQIEKDWNSPDKVMARALNIANQRIETLQIENKELKPKAFFADAVATAESSCLVGELAKIIKANGCDIGQKRLFEWLRANGYLMCRGEAYNQPTQKSMELGLMEIKKRVIDNPDGSKRVTTTTKITGKGQVYFVNKFCKKDD
ncbi:phage antirepressor KilAC domain-containing protein [Amedibacterium intestinale]|uniref:phage antirepressor KilAC domain-containing protein n=1 Tax=Amedibacterium intestinale TaxID=2583452 RepID=UPI000E1FDD98